METGDELKPYTREKVLEEVAECVQQATNWRQQYLTDKWQRADDLFEARDTPELTGQSRPNRSHLFVPVLYQQGLELIQEMVDAFDGVRLPAIPINAADGVDRLSTALAISAFDRELNRAEGPRSWFPFLWTSAHNAIVKGYAAAKWYWDTARDRLAFDAIPLEDLFWDPKASLTREPAFYVHRIYREPSYVAARIEDGTWQGKDKDGHAVSFDELKSAATITDDQTRRNRYYEELDPFSQVDGKDDLLELWEFYWKKDGQWSMSLTIKGVHVLIPPKPWAIQPFQIGYTLPRAHHFDGESIVNRGEDLQIELNKNRNLDMDGRNREMDPRTLASRRAGINLQQFKEGSDLVMANRVDDAAIREFKYSPTVQAMIPRDSITMRDIHGITGRTAPIQGKAEGNVRGSQGIGILTQNARAPLTRRLKCFWSTFVQPGLVKAAALIAENTTDGGALTEIAQMAGAGGMDPDRTFEVLNQARFIIRRDPDLKAIDPEGYERMLGQMVQLAVQAQRVDVAMPLMAKMARASGFPEVAADLLKPVNPAMIPQQGPGKAAPTQPTPPGAAGAGGGHAAQ
jgi:hypothetical protein